MYALYTDKGFEIRVVGSRANVTFLWGAKPMEGGGNPDAVMENLSRRIQELETKQREHEKEKVRPKLSEEAVETLRSEEGVPKWMEKLGAALVRLFKDLEGLEELKPVQFLSNEVGATMWDTKESYGKTTTRTQKNAKRTEEGARSCKDPGQGKGQPVG